MYYNDDEHLKLGTNYNWLQQYIIVQKLSYTKQKLTILGSNEFGAQMVKPCTKWSMLTNIFCKQVGAMQGLMVCLIESTRLAITKMSFCENTDS